MRITDTWLRSQMKPREKRLYATVDGRKGLMVRLHPSGSVSFVFRYRRGATRRVMAFGEYGDSGITLSDAFEMHRQAQQELTRGLDPVEEHERREMEKRRASEARASADTVASLVEQFEHRKLRAERWDAESHSWIREQKAKTRPRKRPEAAAALLKRNLVDVKLDGQTVGSMKARDLTRRQLVRLLDEIVDRGSPTTANRVHALLVQMCNWAAAKDLIPASPMAGVERPGGVEVPRERVLTDDEVKTVWSKLDDAAMGEPTKLALKLLLVTGQRRGELTFAKWSHFDLDGKTWTIPVDLLKSAHSRRQTPEPHVVPLSPLAIEILNHMAAITGSGTYVLPARLNPKSKRPFSERVLSQAVRDNEKHFGVPHWTPHDLRRTAASRMTKLGIPRLHVEKVLNHATGDIAEVYDRHDYLPEKKIALERWGEFLGNLIAGREQTVVPFPRAEPASATSAA